jgi:Na+/H+-dicarboxylate symporter
MSIPHPPRHLYTNLYAQVLTAIVVGVALGYFYPALGAQMKPLGDGFIKLIKMMIAPIIFTTVVVGIAKMGDMKAVGRVGLKTLLYFEAVSTIALLIGLIVVNVFQPGAGINADPATLDAKAIASYTTGAQQLHGVDFVMTSPTTVFPQPTRSSLRIMPGRAVSDEDVPRTSRISSLMYFKNCHRLKPVKCAISASTTKMNTNEVV